MMEIDFNNLTERERIAAENAVIRVRNRSSQMGQAVQKLKDIETVRELFSKGLSRKEIAEKMGFSYAKTVQLINLSTYRIGRMKKRVDAYMEEINGH